MTALNHFRLEAARLDMKQLYTLGARVNYKNNSMA